ncbi:MAG: dicarboxylate-CoA ligase PimA [Thermoleophilia bacterium]|nr:dicarboxylate-CoA ligase PimA [Thermoleophilia bacterium]
MTARALSYTHGTTEVPLRGETIGEMWSDAVARHGDREALVSRHQRIRWTYAELDAQVERCARALLASGVDRGDRVGIWSPNTAEWVVVQFATARIGAILVNLNPDYRSHELEYALRQSGCTLLVLAQGYKGADYPEILAGADAPALRERVVLGRDWDAWLERGDTVPADALAARAAELDFDQPINIQYTSGTTGFPKGATLSHHNILNNGFFVGETLGYTEADRVCIPVPFYHCFGMVLGNLAIVTHGACIVIASEAFEPQAVLEAVTGERCTSLYGVPTMFIAELNVPDFADFDFSSLRTGIMAGSPCPIEVMTRVKTDMHIDQMTICYGMTETSPVSTQTRRGSPLEKQVGTVGQAHPHVEIKVVDIADGRTVRRGERGELCTRGYSVMLGYWENEEATREAIDAARWMHTGDLAEMDDDGYVNIVGRIKDMVIRGGQNIYPREIEEFLYTHPEIADVQAFGVPDERLGEEVCVWVILKDGATLDEDGLKEFCAGSIARPKIPRYVRFVDAFPLTVTGKVQKFRMQETEIEERELHAAAATRTA